MAHFNVLKQIKTEERWKLVAIPRNRKSGYDWAALPEGRYFIEWWERGKRKRQAAGTTTADVLEAVRRRKHALEGRALGIESRDEEHGKRTAIHAAAKHYLESVKALRKPNTLRKYRAVLSRFVEFLPANADPRKVAAEDLNDFMVALKNRHKLAKNSVRHQMIVVAQFLKRHGKGGMTRNLGLRERVISLPREYADSDLKKCFAACTPAERVLFATLLFTGFREEEVVYLFWTDIISA